MHPSKMDGRSAGMTKSGAPPRMAMPTAPLPWPVGRESAIVLPTSCLSTNYARNACPEHASPAQDVQTTPERRSSATKLVAASILLVPA